MHTHIIVSGDTFWNLSKKYGCTVEAIINANPNVVPEQLFIGELIRIPSGNVDVIASGSAPANARLDTILYARVPQWCEPLRDTINSASQKTGVPADLIAAVIYQESGGNPAVNATSNPNSGSDSGLMQVNQYTQNELEGKYPERFLGLSGSAKNIMLGASYLRYLYDTRARQHWGVALRAYNSGPNGVDDNDLDATPVGTGDRTYVKKVFHFWTDLSTGNDLPIDHYESVYGRGF